MFQELSSLGEVFKENELVKAYAAMSASRRIRFFEPHPPGLRITI
jgi:hypothetical protein